MTTAAVAVVLPCHNSRHLLWRSLASVAAQTVPPAQILVLDRGSSDGLSDWLRARWPGVEHRAVPADADAATVGAVVAGAVATAAVAVLQPGDRWDRDCLAALTGARPAPRDEVSGGLVANSDLATPAGAAALASPSRHEPQASPHSLQDAIASLPAASEAILLDLRAASRPLALLNLLGLASLLASSGRSIRALSLADLTWPALEAAPQATPLLVSLGTPLDLRSASEQLCIEELIRRANDRPVRLVLAGLCPTTPQQLSRLLGAALAHPDLELWLGDAVSRRLAASLLGRGRVRLVSPSSLALAPLLRDLTERQPVEPAMLGNPVPGADLDALASDHADWWCGFDPAAVRRLGVALARVLGIGRWLRGPLLQQAWLTTLVGWAAARSIAGEVRTDDLEVALFAAMCGRRVEVVLREPKPRDLLATWREPLASLGIRDA